MAKYLLIFIRDFEKNIKLKGHLNDELCKEKSTTIFKILNLFFDKRTQDWWKLLTKNEYCLNLDLWWEYVNGIGYPYEV